MKPEIDSSNPQQQETALMGESHLNIKPEDQNLSNVSPHTSEEQRLNPVDALNCSQQHQPLEAKSLSPPIPQSMPTMSAVMHNQNLMASSLHSLHHQGSPVPHLPNPGAMSVAHQHVNSGVDSNACAVPEFELARRLGVRFDSSNAAWVARWTDAQNDRKKSRWFSVAKYGNAPARRLAIQACLHNMKPSDFPSLRDLQDVLATFGHPGGPTAPGGYLVPGAEMAGAAGMAGVVRGSGVVDPHHMAGKLGAQFGGHQFMHPHHNPFAAMSGMPNPMAGYAMAAAGGMPGMGMHPGNMGMFVQGVPQQHATQGVAPPESLSVQEGEAGAPEGLMDHRLSQQHRHVGADGQQQLMKAQQQAYQQQQHGGEGLMNMDPNLTQPVKQFDQTTTAASSVSSPSATGGVKLEDAQQQQQQQAAAGSPLHGMGPSAGQSSSDAAFLQSLSAQPPSVTPESSSRFVLSGDSSSQESSDLDTRSLGSRSDEDDEEDEEGGEEGGRSKRKKRKLDESGNAESTGIVAQPAQPNGGAFGQQMNVYNSQANNQHQAANAQQTLQQQHAMAGQQASNYPSYYASLYGGYANASQQMMMHQMNGQAGSPGQAGMHSLPFFLQPQMLPMLHPHFQQHAAAAAAAGFLPHGSMPGMDQSQYHHLMKASQGLYLPHGYGAGAEDSPQSPSGDSPSSVTSPNGDLGGYKRQHGHSGSQSSSSSGGGAAQASAKMTCERGLHYTKCYRGNQECWIAVWNTKGGRIMHEAFDVVEMGFEAAKQKAREARDAAHSNNVAVTENSRPSWKSHSNTGIPHVSLDSQQLRFRAHKFGRRLCRSFSFGRRRGSYASRESAFDAAVLWLIQTPTEEEIAAVSGCNSKIEDI